MQLTREKLRKLALINRRVEVDEREIILGYERRSPAFSRLSSILIGGMTDQGKTVITAYLCCMAAIAGAKLLVIDPHCHERRHGLAAKMEPLRDFFVAEPVDFTDIEAVTGWFDWLAAEYQGRKAHGGMVGKRPLFLVIDEFNELLAELSKEEAKATSAIIGKIARGGRKYGMFVVLCAHNWNLSSAGGSDVRKNIPTRICVNSEVSEMAMVLNLSDRCLIGTLTTPPLTKGEAVVKQPGFGVARMSYPLTGTDDCEAVAAMLRRIEGRGRRKAQERPRTWETRREAAGNVFDRPFPARETMETARQALSAHASVIPFPVTRVTETTAETVAEAVPEMKTVVEATAETVPEIRAETVEETLRRLFAEGMPHWKIAREVKLSGRKYPQYQKLCNQLGIPLQQEKAISSKEWEAIKEAYDHRCPSCGRGEPEVTLTKDHVVARASAGTNSAENIQPLCLECNQRKHKRTVSYERPDRGGDGLGSSGPEHSYGETILETSANAAAAELQIVKQ